MEKDEVFKIIQFFLKHPPVVIWGSGATVDYGLPSAKEIQENIRPYVENKNKNANLEKMLEGIPDSNGKLDQIKDNVKSLVLKGDLNYFKQFLSGKYCFNPIFDMFNKFCRGPHPKKIDVITTNYDRVLEYVATRMSVNYYDGFRKEMGGSFDGVFEVRDCINIIKPHGSLNWSFLNTGASLWLPAEYKIEGTHSAIVLPTVNKYEESYREPFRSLITKSDECISSGKSFLVVGFGFNDNHITPKLEDKMKEGVPVVIITKEASSTLREILDRTSNYCLLEENEGKTRVTLKKKNCCQSLSWEGDYWKLGKFMEIL